ncbi:MAG: formate dehydrogenase, partial [Pseudoxanthomonas suwonensis]
MQDMANADCIVIEGSNMAEAHPVGFQWVMEAKKRGAKVIHVDPRFTRTSANADRHIPIRSGSDIALLGGVIRYVLENDLWFEEYVKTFTNASTIIREEFVDAEDAEGIFSGYDHETGAYENQSWAYQGDKDMLQRGLPDRDETLQHPRTVFQILKRHYARYTPEMVEATCGIAAEDFEYLVKAITENSGRERTTCFAYALGWTQHQGGPQMIRTAAVLQLLMGNVGRPGSGIMALRGHATIQGSTDIPTLYHILPGYLPMAKVGQDSFAEYARAIGKKEQKGFWANADIYAINLLKAWWGDAATAENEWAYHYLPKLTGAHGTYQTLMRMLEGGVDGFFLFGQNPAVGSANGRMQRQGLAKLKWLVVRDFYMIESATFWKDSAEIESGETRTEDIGTEVFFMPAANHTEKAGSFTQTQRMVQWR